MKSDKFFLPHIYKRNKFLFWLSACFIAGQAFFTYKGVETVPFFNYGMYSEVFDTQKNHEVMAIHLDSVRIDQYPQSRFPLGLAIETLEYYHRLNQRNFSDTILVTINKRFKDRLSDESLSNVIDRLSNDPIDKERYERWLFSFIKGFYKEDAKSLRVEVEKYEFVNNRLAFVSKELLFEHGAAE